MVNKSSIVQALYTKTKTLKRSSQTQHQTQQAREANASINCSTDLELKQVFLASPSSRRVIEALHQGCSLGHAAAIASVPVNAARKLLAVLQKQ